MDDPLQKEIFLQLANTLPECIIQIVISYRYKFLNKELGNHNNIDKVIDLGKDRIALITRQYEILVYNVSTNNLLYALPLVDNLIDIHITLLSKDKIIIGYLLFDGWKSYTEIRDSTTGELYQYIPETAIDNNNIVLPNKIISLTIYFTVKHIFHNIPNICTRNNTFSAAIIDDNNLVITNGSNLSFYDTKSIEPYYCYCHIQNVECSFPIVLANNTILYYLCDISVFIWFNYKKREVISSLNTDLRYITQIYKISENKGIIIVNYTTYCNKMYLCDLNTAEKLLKYEAKETEGPITILGCLPDDRVVSSRGNNIIINNINGNCNYNISSSQYSHRSIVLEDGKIVLFKPESGTIAILS